VLIRYGNEVARVNIIFTWFDDDFDAGRHGSTDDIRGRAAVDPRVRRADPINRQSRQLTATTLYHHHHHSMAHRHRHSTDIRTRSQAVARRIADRTASQYPWGHLMSSVTWPFDTLYVISYWWSFGTKPLSLTVSEIFNAECSAMIDMTLIRPLNEGQGHSF